MSGYNDPEMMKAAIELAQSFSRAKGGGKNRAGGGGLGGRKEYFEPYQPRQQSRYGQVAAPPRQTFAPSMPSLRPLAPPPSRRNYGGSGDFATRRAACRPVIGNLGRDFLISSGVKAESDEPKDQEVAGKPVPVAAQESQKNALADKNSNGGTRKPEPLSTPPRSSGNGQLENILDAFYAILDKKPSIGQEIDTLAEALSKADLNDPGTPTLDTPPVKENVKSGSRQCTCQELDGQGVHEKTCPRHTAQEKKAKEIDEARNSGEMKASDAKVNNAKVTNVKANDTKATPQSPDVDVDGDIDVGVGVEPSSGPAYTHSRKLSPVAPVFVPRRNQDPGQAMDTNGEDSSSTQKPTKGLSASMWA
ncbi:hypothetical protein MKX08_005349 [Trichoderma sp. CBMAI-0020]|nr:hypothetical protein MKX08_005349 [Trichoderma sp. CBMAI-0020]WOD45764.1 hypothetical protein [Trichoderma atroviride]